MNERIEQSLRIAGICAVFGPLIEPHTKPYLCCLDAGHAGAHVASIAGQVVDTWPQHTTPRPGHTTPRHEQQ